MRQARTLVTNGQSVSPVRHSLWPRGFIHAISLIPKGACPVIIPIVYFDVHTHLTHARFSEDVGETIERARVAQLGAIVVIGLEPRSNRQILDMASADPLIWPALGIYPVDAVNDMLSDDFVLPVSSFDVEEEIQYIERMAADGRIRAVGECGLDGHWLPESTFSRQERVFEALIDIAMRHELPLIIHTRKREARAADILRNFGARYVDFHCYGGKVKQAVRWAREDRWWFSIPANARKSEAFTKMLKELPEDRVLTETDAPYLGPERGVRNEPANVVTTVA